MSSLSTVVEFVKLKRKLLTRLAGFTFIVVAFICVVFMVYLQVKIK